MAGSPAPTPPGSPAGRPGRRPPVAPPVRQPVPRLFGRAIVAKCPWCGSRRTFLAGWFKRYDRCRTCGVSWHREEGFELGTITINTIVTFASIAIAMGVGFAVWGTDVPLVTFMAIVGAIAVLMPIAIYPLTYTIWLAFDLAVKPPDRAELDEMMAAVASGAAAQPFDPRQRRKRST